MATKKSSRSFREFYADWSETLRSTLLPLLRCSISCSTARRSTVLPVSSFGGAMLCSTDLLAIHVHTIHGHFQAYFHALDLAARRDVSQLLSPDWRPPPMLPFLWIGDLHPLLLKSLLRSVLSNDFQPSERLAAKLEEIERLLRRAVPIIMKRFHYAQAGLVEPYVAGWSAARAAGDGALASAPGDELDTAVKIQLKELRGVFVEANRLRRTVLAEIVAAAEVEQAAIFLEALANFVAGFHDPSFLHEFEQCRAPISKSPGKSS